MFLTFSFTYSPAKTRDGGDAQASVRVPAPFCGLFKRALQKLTLNPHLHFIPWKETAFSSLAYPLRMPVKEVTRVTAKIIKAAGGPICETFPQLHVALPGVLLFQL